MNVIATFLLFGVSFVTLIAVVVGLSRSTHAKGLAAEVRGELRVGREEGRGAARELREEISTSTRALDETLRRTLSDGETRQEAHLAGMAQQLKDLAESNDAAAESIRRTLDTRVQALQSGNETKLEAIRREVADGLKTNMDVVTGSLEHASCVQQTVLGQFTQRVGELASSNQTTLERIRTTLDERVKDLQTANDRGREVQGLALDQAAQRQTTELQAMTAQLQQLTESNRVALDGIRLAFDARVKALQDSNEGKLDQMRRIVEERLQDTLEKRLGESFRLVSERLEAVHQGLGDMQKLASGVGDLKRVLTNVKTRGTWAEYQLGAILEQILTSEQYAKNVCVKEGSPERVEYAVRLPGPIGELTPWLPIDSKFLTEDYQRLQAAAEAGDPAAVQAASDALARALRAAARDIHDKYVCPPSTSDYAIMFLATEGLYAEALRQPGLADELQQRYRVVIAGPTTLAAILSSVRMSFQTLAVQQRATEVWQVLGAVKTEFGKFGVVLAKVQRQLQTASRTIDETRMRTGVMERRLRAVEQLNPTESAKILTLPTAAARVSEEEDHDDADAARPAEALLDVETANEPG